MIVCFRCTKDLKCILDGLVESGQYKDYTEVISVALHNLKLLDEEVLRTGTVFLGSDVSQPSVSPTNGEQVGSSIAYNTQLVAETEAYTEPSSLKLDPKKNAPSMKKSMPKIFTLNSIRNSNIVLADMAPIKRTESEGIPLDRWVFGQFNRLLPLKASTRALMHLLSKETQGVSVDYATKVISEAAIDLGALLADHDKRHEIARDDAVSTAFPVPSKNVDKSQRRYASQFVANVDREGNLHGLMTAFRMINFVDLSRETISLTKPGNDFALLPNPILDQNQEDPLEKFSQEEIDFLIAHIISNVPEETFAYRAILKAIKNGADRPTTIDDALRTHLSEEKQESLSASFLASQRSGAISRMTDLGLVQRVRDGIRVSYVSTKAGDTFLTGKTIRNERAVNCDL